MYFKTSGAVKKKLIELQF